MGSYRSAVRTPVDSIRTIDTVDFGPDGSLRIIDQTRLPGRAELLDLWDRDDMVQAIRSLAVRGAPAIGVAAAIGLASLAQDYPETSLTAFLHHLEQDSKALKASRPTAVNLSWALDRMCARAREAAAALISNKGAAEDLKDVLQAEAIHIRNEDITACEKLGELGLTLLRPGMTLMTHCNAGRLAAVRHGTATAPIYLGQEKGYDFRVYVDETRPLLQGSRLTATELSQAGIPVTLCTEGMARSLLSGGTIDAILVGSDRIAANGDIANKIGTATLALVARHYDIPFYVLAPWSTVDLAAETGDAIPIEQRDPSEVTTLWFESRMAPEGVGVYNPAFDITPAKDITAIVTDRGIVRPPYGGKLAGLAGLADQR